VKAERRRSGSEFSRELRHDTHLLLGDEKSDSGVLARRDAAAGDAFHTKLVDDVLRPVGGVVDVHLVGNDADSLGLVFGVLKLPVGLRMVSRPFRKAWKGEQAEPSILSLLREGRDLSSAEGIPDLEVEVWWLSIGGLDCFGGCRSASGPPSKATEIDAPCLSHV
jgi:hypothetical protein